MQPLLQGPKLKVPHGQNFVSACSSLQNGKPSRNGIKSFFPFRTLKEIKESGVQTDSSSGETDHRDSRACPLGKTKTNNETLQESGIEKRTSVDLQQQSGKKENYSEEQQQTCNSPKSSTLIGEPSCEDLQSTDLPTDYQRLDECHEDHSSTAAVENIKTAENEDHNSSN